VLNNISISPFTGLPTHLFPDGTNVQRRTVDDDAVGVGDVLLRTKYHFLSSNGLNLASGLGLRLPTGDEDDFQGLDDFVVTPFLAASQEYGRFDFHLQVGVDINADDTERSRVRYGAGVTVQLIEQAAFLLDIIGSSNITDQDISVSVPVIEGAVETGRITVSRELRTDIVDLSVGFKAVLTKSVIGFANVFIPLNNDGLRADAVPSMGLEMSF
jgi:hypothetical protein